MLQIASGDWIVEHENCLVLGNNGTGKTHLGLALGRAAVVPRPICHRTGAQSGIARSPGRPSLLTRFKFW